MHRMRSNHTAGLYCDPAVLFYLCQPHTSQRLNGIDRERKTKFSLTHRCLPLPIPSPLCHETRRTFTCSLLLLPLLSLSSFPAPSSTSPFPYPPPPPSSSHCPSPCPPTSHGLSPVTTLPYPSSRPAARQFASTVCAGRFKAHLLPLLVLPAPCTLPSRIPLPSVLPPYSPHPSQVPLPKRSCAPPLASQR